MAKSYSRSILQLWCRLRVVPHFSSRIVERAKRERAWKSPHARKARRAFLAFRSLYYPWAKIGTTLRSTWKLKCLILTFMEIVNLVYFNSIFTFFDWSRSCLIQRLSTLIVHSSCSGFPSLSLHYRDAPTIALCPKIRWHNVCEGFNLHSEILPENGISSQGRGGGGGINYKSLYDKEW